MSNIDNITSNNSVVAQEQLFTELTLEEGAVIEGGAIYDLSNNSGIPLGYTINGITDFLNPGGDKKYSYSTAPTVSFDSQIGPGYVPAYQQLLPDPGTNVFDVASGNTLVLISTTPGGFGTTPPPTLRFHSPL